MSYRPIWGKPHLVTDWGEEQEEHETHWTALFYDLILVAAVMAISDPFVESEGEEGEVEEMKTSLDFNPDLPEIDSMTVSDAILKFLSILMMWNSLSEIYARFEDESLAGHMAFFFHCYGMACSAAACVEALDDQYIGLGVGIIIARLGLIVMHIRPAIYIPRARVHCALRILQLFVVIVMLSIGLLKGSPETFRQILAAIIVWDLISIPVTVLLKDHRLPVHVATVNDRVQDGILVVFGEAILMLALKSREAKGLRSEYYYEALALSMWLIYSMALHAYHIFPSVEDHALRRSVPAGTTWVFISYTFQVFLLGAAIGLKRIYVLVGAGEHMVDSATKQVLVFGVTGVLLGVVLMRFCHYGMGRHPSKHDPPRVKAIKYFWWISMVLLGGSPCILFATVMDEHSSPILCLSSLSILMGTIVLLEAALSNGVAHVSNQYCTATEKREGCHIQSFTSANNNYLSIPNEVEGEQQRLV
mmetsp:Transcript_11902/g.16441  ORF Transcript_11902/g.16441 Transcript_11902/m.16441 type:complete len:475 (-) Transcript_11902:166-1590(-)|eukprot:CAMPEP_0185733334 /NCGR_PEP_ID=MMETSP1171-20130828/19140_1 /TAXON_ID=374046 /ORGANISM="Helicotheca tamensis, Strain CCMP826" /LENGTH=474 /DNA_ID=CAMNT_0028403037 /DNA_START=106 /DNA_END=1530 /DNA_ORIENTATION=+